MPLVLDHGINTRTDQKFFVMERLGISMVDVIKKNKLIFSYAQVISLTCQLITSLESIHSLGYVHCDIKPDNIMFGQVIKDGVEDKTRELKATLIDFGLAHSIIDTRKCSLGLNFANMPPELVSLFQKDQDDFSHIENIISDDPFNNFKGNMLYSSKNGFCG